MADLSTDTSRPHLTVPVSLPDRNRFGARLPAPLSSFVGREHDVAAVCALVRRDDVRLLTLTGPGGVGKSRLALRVATDLAGDFPNGIAYVALAPISDPSLVLSTIAQAVGMRESSVRSVPERLADFLGGQRLLLVLDNFEQVAAAAGPVADLLIASSDPKALITSRVALRVGGEQEFAVLPLAVPAATPANPLDVAENPAVALFVQRTLSVKTDFALTETNAMAIAEVCRRLDGLPLAIELAAARSKILSPPALLARLAAGLDLLTGGPHDQPARLQTMRAAIAWSHDLLTDEEQVLFRRLAVLVGGFTLDAAEAVIDARGLGIDVLDGVAALVDRSLLRQVGDPEDEPRFEMLETIRAFGLERLDASGEEPSVRRALASWCLALAEETEPPLLGFLESWPFARLEANYGNFRSTLTWLAETGDTIRALGLAAALGPFWYFSGHLEEGLGWLERTLAPSVDAPPSVRAKTLFWQGAHSVMRGDIDQGLSWLEESLALHRQAGDHVGVIAATILRGGAAEYRGDNDAAMVHYEEALELSREVGEDRLAFLSLINLSDGAYRQGDGKRSRALAQEALILSASIGDRMLHAFALIMVAQAELDRGDTSKASHLLGESLTLIDLTDNRPAIVAALIASAAVQVACGQAEQAARLLGAADAVREATGVRLPLNHELQRRTERMARAAQMDDAFATAWEAGRNLTREEAISEALHATTALAPPADLPTGAVRSADVHGLSEREIDVLILLVEGRSDREIGDALFISYRTAQKHVANICAKLEVSSRTAAATAAIRAGIVPSA